MERLALHHALLEQWNRRINLVSRGTIPGSWQRHFADSAQLWRYCPPGAGTWLDLGSGAGFPGLVVAAFAAEQKPDLRVTLVESDQRKAAFLVTVAQRCGLDVAVLPERIESLAPQGADVVSARALAPLGDLLPWAEKHLRHGGICLFPKGERVHNEIADAARKWRFDHRLYPSRTDSKAAILEIGAIARA
jgi:16S rRNA (guanine527-N7)-methyltransferase